MDNRKKNIIYTILLITSLFAVYLYRKNQTIPFLQLEGKTMGTTYHISYFDRQGRNLQREVDSVLQVFNQSLSTYIPDSEISTFNNKQNSFTFSLPYFYEALAVSQQVVTDSRGAFDPTVGPLANAWGFGERKPVELDSAAVDSILNFIGFEKIQFNKDSVWKSDARIQLNFNAIAKGYGVDVVADFIQSKGIENLFVEIGGEVVARGRNLQKDKLWEIGILDPGAAQPGTVYKAYALIDNRAVATSGNYFNYREVDGKRVSHTLDPESGYPVQREILSASIFAPNCAIADGWATACMVMGHEKAIELLKNKNDIDALLIYSSPDGTINVFMTERLAATVTLNESL